MSRWATLAGAPTLTRLTPFGTLSRQAGEGYLGSFMAHGDEPGHEIEVPPPHAALSAFLP